MSYKLLMMTLWLKIRAPVNTGAGIGSIFPMALQKVTFTGYRNYIEIVSFGVCKRYTNLE